MAVHWLTDQGEMGSYAADQYAKIKLPGMTAAKIR